MSFTTIQVLLVALLLAGFGYVAYSVITRLGMPLTRRKERKCERRPRRHFAPPAIAEVQLPEEPLLLKELLPLESPLQIELRSLDGKALTRGARRKKEQREAAKKYFDPRKLDDPPQVPSTFDPKVIH